MLRTSELVVKIMQKIIILLLVLPILLSCNKSLKITSKYYITIDSLSEATRINKSYRNIHMYPLTSEEYYGLSREEQDKVEINKNLTISDIFNELGPGYSIKGSGLIVWPILDATFVARKSQSPEEKILKVSRAWTFQYLH